MSRGTPLVLYPWGQQPPAASAQIVPTDHDVLSGRGVNIAQHPGNERFRTLVKSRHDDNYCTQYSTSEKRAVAREIVEHIKNLDPPGRFLKRAGRSKNSRGLEGPWEELSEQEVIKKTCQALRDCNRQDRSGYAATVEAPQDVKQNQEARFQSGLSNREQAQQAAAASLNESSSFGEAAKWNDKRPLEIDTSGGSLDMVSPAPEESGEWAKKPRLDSDSKPLASETTPTTAASSGGVLGETSLLESATTSASSTHERPSEEDHPGFMVHENMPPSPAAAPYDNFGTSFANAFHPGDKLRSTSIDEIDPLTLAAATAAVGTGSEQYDENHSFAGCETDFVAPSPLHDQNLNGEASQNPL